MRIQDLHILPKFRDSLSYLYVDNCRIEQQDKAIVMIDANGKVPVPCAAVCLLMLGPGTSITHAAISALADNGCLVCWDFFRPRF
jgi:CRISPR-associated protein Cas1